MSQHSNFILKPISDVLSDALVVLSTIGDGIDAIPVSEYLLHSAFLRMTGFQELLVNAHAMMKRISYIRIWSGYC